MRAWGDAATRNVDLGTAPHSQGSHVWRVVARSTQPLDLGVRRPPSATSGLLTRTTSTERPAATMRSAFAVASPGAD